MKKRIMWIVVILVVYVALLKLEANQINKEKDELIVFLSSRGYSDLELDVTQDSPSICKPFVRPYVFRASFNQQSVAGIVCKSDNEITFELNKE
jgi:hypothetical protein